MMTSDKSIAAEILALHLHEIMHDPRYRARFVSRTGQESQVPSPSSIRALTRMAEGPSNLTGDGDRHPDEDGEEDDGTVFSVVSVLDMDGTIQPKNKLTGNTTDNNLSNSAAVGPIKALLAAGTVVAVNSGNRALLQIRRILAGFGPGELWMLERMIICVQGGSIAYRLVPVVVEKSLPPSMPPGPKATPEDQVLREVYVDAIEIPEWSRWLQDLPRDRERRQQELLQTEQEWLFDADDEVETEQDEDLLVRRVQSQGHPRPVRHRHRPQRLSSDGGMDSGETESESRQGSSHLASKVQPWVARVHTDSHVKYDRSQRHLRRHKSATIGKAKKPRRRRRRHTLLLVADDELAGNEAKVEGAISIHVGAVKPEEVDPHLYNLHPFALNSNSADHPSYFNASVASPPPEVALAHHLNHPHHLNNPLGHHHQDLEELEEIPPVKERSGPTFPERLHDQIIDHHIHSRRPLLRNGSDPNLSQTGVSSLADDEFDEEGSQSTCLSSSQETDTTLKQRPAVLPRAQTAAGKRDKPPQTRRHHSSIHRTGDPDHLRPRRYHRKPSRTSSSQTSVRSGNSHRRPPSSETGRSRHRGIPPRIGPPEVRIVTDSAGLSWIQADRPQDEGLSQALTSLHR